MSKLNLDISSNGANEFMQDDLVYDYIYIHDMDINEATKRAVKENRPALVRYPHGAVRYPHGAPSDIISDIIIKKMFS